MAEAVRVSGPVSVTIGNFEVVSLPHPEPGRPAVERVLLNGKEVKCRTITIHGGVGQVWTVDLTFYPTDENGRPIL